MTELSDVSQHIHSNACELESVLLSEASTLKRADSAEKIEAVAVQKMDLVQALDQLARRRQQLIDESSDGEQHDRDPAWQHTLATLSRCKILNNQAGADITVQSRYKQRALEILGTPHAEMQLYSASGTAQFAGPKQALGKA
jgi:flagellar biosynthesis/type III secretory pathway chaperone